MGCVGEEFKKCWFYFCVAQGQILFIISIITGFLNQKFDLGETKVRAGVGELTTYQKSTVVEQIDGDGEPINFERLYIEVDKPHPALHIIYAPHGTVEGEKTTVMNKSGTLAEQQRCAQVGIFRDDFLIRVAVWTTTDVPDVAVILVNSRYLSDISTTTYNGTNYWWFEKLAVGAAKGANNNVTVPHFKLPRESGIFVCNPLNNSALFDVFISAEFSIFQASSSGTEWVGKKSMSVAPSNSQDETIGAQIEFDEPCKKPLEVKVKIRGEMEGLAALVILLSVAASLFVVLCIAMVLVVVVPRYGPRLCFRFGNNNYTNIPDK